MYIRAMFLMPVMLFSLNACAGPLPDEARARSPSGDEHALASRETHAMELECGAARYVLPGPGESVRVESSRSAPANLPAPGGMQDFAPVGMGCAVSASGQQYLVVQYGEVPSGCKVCEWFFIYDARGAPMNEAIPPTRGYAETLEANNDGYERLLNELGLRHPSIEYPEFAQR